MYGLSIVNFPLQEELIACELANKVNLDFDDGLHYYFLKRMSVSIISFDKDFDKTDIKRLEPKEVVS